MLGRLFDTRFNSDPRKLYPQVGKPIQFRDDSKNLWLVDPNGKELHIKQRYSDGGFHDSRCVVELHHHLLQDHPPSARPSDVAADAVYVPLSSHAGYWTKCFLARDRAVVCIARGPKGEEFSHVYQAVKEAQNDQDLIVDPLRTDYDKIVLATGQALIRKYD